VPREQQGQHRPPLRLQILVAQGGYESAYQEVVDLLQQEPGDVDLLLLVECGRLAQEAPVPSVAMPALPFSPVKFSGLIDRDWAFETR